MDNLLEIIVPLVFMAIYFFSNILGKSKDEADAPPPFARERESEEDAEAAERQRRIQEEIRRKIMERRQGASGGGAASPPPVQKPGERPRGIEVRREAREMRKESREVFRELPQSPPPIAEPLRRAAPEPSAFSWDESDNAYETKMQTQLRQLEAAKLRAEKLKKEAVEKRKEAESKARPRRRPGGYFTGPVRESLRDPQAARVAFIYGEVLGPPVSLRNEQSVPGLN